MKVTTHHGEMHQSRGDYGDAISHHRAPVNLNRWAAALLLIAAFGGSLLLPTGCDEARDAQASELSHRDAIATAQAQVPPAIK